MRVDRLRVGVVYGLRLVDNPKIRYVGITINGAEARLNSHINGAYAGGKYAVHKWIRKHGREKITVDILETVESFQKLGEREIYWIAELNTHISLKQGGLNCTWGGEFGNVWDSLTFEQQERAREHMRDLNRKQSTDPDLAAARSKRSRKNMTALWEREEFRELQAQLLQERHNDPDFAARNSRRASERMTQLHQDPEFAARRDERTRKMHQNPEFAEANRNRARDTLAKSRKNPTFVEKSAQATSKTMRKLHQDQEFAEANRIRGIRTMHIRWHVNRNMVNQSCIFCVS